MDALTWQEASIWCTHTKTFMTGGVPCELARRRRVRKCVGPSQWSLKSRFFDRFRYIITKASEGGEGAVMRGANLTPSFLNISNVFADSRGDIRRPDFKLFFVHQYLSDRIHTHSHAHTPSVFFIGCYII